MLLFYNIFKSRSRYPLKMEIKIDQILNVWVLTGWGSESEETVKNPGENLG